MRRFTLEELGLVDSDPEPAFTNLAELASRLTGAPVSLVSFIQEAQDRQYFKARVGLDIEQTPLSHSFCRQVVSTGAPLIVDDALKDYRVKENPAVEEFGVRAYLGMPVRDIDGEPVASLCVIDGKPHRWSCEEQIVLGKLAQCVTDAIRLKVEVLRSEGLRFEQRHFAHAMSHDIKGPLHTLSWVLDEVADEHDADFSDDTRRMIELARSTVSRTGRMVDDLLDYSTVEKTLDLELVPVDLAQVIGEIEESLSADIACRDARVHVALPSPTVHGNRRQLSMLFQNLIGNALKFHRPGKPPCVRVFARTGADVVEVTVSDNGIGIPAKDQHGVFDPFQQLNRREDYEGSGIGLSLVRRVIENHGGEVRIESDGSSGTSFIVSLPRRAVPPDALGTLSTHRAADLSRAA